MTDIRRNRAAEIQDAIRQILSDDWNPIGFAGSLPDDEYDSYIGGVYRILAGSRSEQELIDYLRRTEDITVGVAGAPSNDHLRPVARKLLQLDVRL